MNTQGPSQPENPRELRQTAPVYRTHAAAEERRRGRRMLPLSTFLLVAVVGGALLVSSRFQKSSEGDTAADTVASSSSSGSGSGTATASASTASSGYGGWSGSNDTSSSESAGGSSSPAAGGSGSTTPVAAVTSGTGNSPPPAVTEGVTELSTRVAAILKKHCFDCHGLEQKVENFIVTDHGLLLDTAGTRPADERYVVAGDLEASVLWQRSGGEFRDMPPEEREQLTAAELADIRTWIETGAAPFPTEGIREQMPRMELWRLVRDDLNQADEADRSHYRYFSFLNLHNDSFATQIGRNRGNYSDRDIRLARAALSKLVNSLSYMPAAVAPVPLGDRQLVMRIDLRDYGWVDLKVWAKLQEAYPYGIRLTVNPDEQLRTLVKEVNTLSGTELPVLRADWFIDTAPRAELYYTIMALPGTVGELESLLGVDPIEDFKNNKLKRAGFSSSGVSKRNRLVDR
ncbi:MAG: hypothetical protein KDA79_24315, partial [Planctomycetaceae bacterium]|nr:hypothetical protein [Planctomycetaceae bacterium]